MSIGSTQKNWSLDAPIAECLEASRLQSKALDAELTLEEIGQPKQHLRRCDNCGKRCDELRFLRRAARQYGLHLLEKAAKS